MAFFVAVGYGVIVPAIPVFAKSFGVSKTAVGLIISSFAFARFGSGLISGRLVDKFGERKVLAIGLIFVAISSLFAGLSQSYWQLLVFRAAGGLGSSMFSVSAGALLMRSVNDSQRGRAQSLYNGGFLFGGMAGPAFGGLLTAISLRAPFFVYAVTLCFASFTTTFFLHEKRLGHRIEESESQSDRPTLKYALSLPTYRSILLITFASNWVLLGLRNSILPLFVTEKLHASTAIVGFGFTVSAIAQGAILIIAGRLSDTRGRRFVIITGTSLIIGAMSLLMFASHSSMYFASMLLFGFGGAFMGTGPAGVVGDLFGGKGGQVIALWQMSGDAGAIVGPVVLGYLADSISYNSAFLITTVVLVIALVLGLRLRKPATL